MTSLPPPLSLTTPPPAKSRIPLILAAIGMTALVLFLAVGGGVLAYKRHNAAKPAAGGSGAVVRVVMTSGSGTGFFVKGPDAFAYVATAFHVISNGEPILIERTIDVANQPSFVEAYPDAEVVAFDAEADLAIIRLRSVGAERFPRFDLAKEPKKDEEILSYGFPESSLAKQFGMVSKPGKVLSVVKFPSYDHETKTVLRNDAVDGLLVSTEIEPGFSGGPTCNSKGEVIGVNVTKDMAHRAQNGAVSVSALAKLIAAIKPRPEPTPEEVKTFLVKVEQQWLLEPIEKRATTPADDFVSTSDVPRLDALAKEIRKLENDASTNPKTQLSGRAMLGLTLLRLPGRPLETYLAPSTRHALASCEERERGLREFFGKLVPSTDLAPAEEAARAKCLVLATRPLGWDLAALSMQWEGKERSVSVSRVETVDAERHVYRASVKFGGLDHLVDVWLAGDGGRLRLKLFENDGRPVGLLASRSTPASAFQGAWRRSEPRTASDYSKDIGRDFDSDTEVDETVSIATGTNNSVTVTHTLRKHIYLKGNLRMACGGNNGSTIDIGIEQTFTGEISEGSITAMSAKPARPLGGDMQRCAPLLHYKADRMIALKRVDQSLIMVRTDGVGFPETAELTR